MSSRGSCLSRLKRAVFGSQLTVLRWKPSRTFAPSAVKNGLLVVGSWLLVGNLRALRGLRG